MNRTARVRAVAFVLAGGPVVSVHGQLAVLRSRRVPWSCIAAGGSFALARLADGTVTAWGRNDHGQLGLGVADAEGAAAPVGHLPRTVSGVRNVMSVAAGADHALALLADGTVRAWGSNAHGQLGNGSPHDDPRRTVYRDSPVPVLVPGIANAVGIAASRERSVALLADGTVWSWGDGSEGAAGDGVYATSLMAGTERLVPVEAVGIRTAVAIAAGSRHTLALLANGTVWAWGWNEQGQLGNASKKASAVPVQVPGISNAIAIAAGTEHSLAVLADGSVRAWGWNVDGRLGNGTKGEGTDSSVPVAVHGVADAVGVAAWAQSYALLADGSLRAWGYGYYGALGAGTSEHSARPLRVKGITTAAEVAAGGSAGVALLTDGTVRAWGGGMISDPGNAAHTSKVPVPVAGVTNAFAPECAGEGRAGGSRHHRLGRLRGGHVDSAAGTGGVGAATAGGEQGKQGRSWTRTRVP